MKTIIIGALTSLSLFGYDCSAYVPTDGLGDMNHEVFCRKIIIVDMISRYDKASIKMGTRYSIHDAMNDAVTKAINTETEQCYETCLLANKKY